MVFVLIIFFPILIILLVWLNIFLFAHTNAVPQKSLKRSKKVLACFPHPDDEVFLCGGILRKFAAQGANVTLITCTKGECGTEDASLHEALRTIRTKELSESAKFLHISNLIHCNHGDGQLSQKKAELKIEFEKKLNEIKPDLVLTYDLSGLYGHPDHIALSEIITEVLHEKKGITLWYVTLPKRILGAISLPTHMAQNTEVLEKRTTPTGKIWIGHYVIDKTRAMYAHKSQLPSFKKALPFWMPLWFWHSIFLWEYIHEPSHRVE